MLEPVYWRGPGYLAFSRIHKAMGASQRCTRMAVTPADNAFADAFALQPTELFTIPAGLTWLLQHADSIERHSGVKLSAEDIALDPVHWRSPASIAFSRIRKAM